MSVHCFDALGLVRGGKSACWKGVERVDFLDIKSSVVVNLADLPSGLVIVE